MANIVNSNVNGAFDFTEADDVKTEQPCRDVSDTVTEEAKRNDEVPDLLYRVNDSPPWHISLIFAFQQFLLGIGTFVTFPLLVMTILCADDSASLNYYRTSMIGTSCVVIGLATFLQTTFGVRLPVMQGVTGAYFVATIAIMQSQEWQCPTRLDLSANKTTEEADIDVHKNGTIIIRDLINNKSIDARLDSFYYRDNDGGIYDSSTVWLRRLREIQGAVICSGILQLLIGCSGVMGFLIRFIGPLTIAPTLTLILYGLIDTAVNVSSSQWGIVVLISGIFFITSVCMVNVNVPYPKCKCTRRSRSCGVGRAPIFSMFPILFAIAIGWLVCYIVTVAGGFSDDPSEPSYQARTDTRKNAVSESAWFRFPYPFQYGWPTFTASSVIGMCAAVIPGILESIGDYNATSCVCREPPPPKHAVNRGILFEGIGIILAGMFGTGNAVTSWSSNIVVVGISRVASRRVFQFLGLLVIFIGLFTKFLSIFSTLPTVILGGIMCSTNGMILAVGISTLRHVDMTKSRNLFIFGFSVFMGMVVSRYTERYPERVDVNVMALTNIFRSLLRNSMFVGGMVGFILDNIAPGSRRSRGLETFYGETSKPENTEESLSAYDLPFNTAWNWTRWIPFCPRYGSKTTRS